MKTLKTKNNIEKLAEIVRGGGLVAVPTETVYGLAGNALDEQAVRRIYEVKGRPEVKPLSLMVADAHAMERWCVDVPMAAHALAARFWPGPLTIVLRSGVAIPSITRAGGETVQEIRHRSGKHQDECYVQAALERENNPDDPAGEIHRGYAVGNVFLHAGIT